MRNILMQIALLLGLTPVKAYGRTGLGESKAADFKGLPFVIIESKN